MTKEQLLWYSYNISQDETETFDLIRSMAEYMMSFVNPEGVKSIRESRDTAKESSFKPEDVISNKEDLIKDLKGLGLGLKDSETNNNRELGKKVDLSSSLFDLTRDF